MNARETLLRFLHLRRAPRVVPPPEPPMCPEPWCQNEPMNDIPGEYCSDHYGIEQSVKRLGRSIDRLGRTLRSTP